MNRLGFVALCVYPALAACDTTLDAPPTTVTSAGLSPKAWSLSAQQARICTTLADRAQAYASRMYIVGLDGERLHFGNQKMCEVELTAGWSVPSTGFALGNGEVDRLACDASLAALPVAFHPNNLPGDWGMALADMLADCSEPSVNAYD